MLDIPFGKDLSIAPTDIVFSHTHPLPGETVPITVTVHNAGLQSVPDTDGAIVRVYRTSPSYELIGAVTLTAPLMHNGTFEFAVIWTAIGGLNEITVFVDPLDAVLELSETSNVATCTVGRPPPPRFLVATADPEGETVLLGWGAPETSGLAGYRVYRSTSQGSDYQAVGTTTESQYVDSGLRDGTAYYYVVTTIDDFGVESVYSDEVSATPLREILTYLPVVMRESGAGQ